MKSWKDYLLSSGLPLEQSIIQQFRSSEFQHVSEYKYERVDSQGSTKIFSVDVHAYKYASPWAEFFVECKYRHEGTQWIFIPDEYDNLLDEFSYETLIILDLFQKSRFNRKELERFTDSIPLCGKGIEILPNDKNPKSIEQSIQQLKYALLEEAIGSIKDQLDWNSSTHILIPITVTTALLRRLNSDVTISDIKNANEIDEISSVEKYLIVKQDPDIQYSRYAKTRIKNCFDERLIAKYDEMKPSPIRNFKHFTNWFSQYYPSKYFVVNFNFFEEFISKIIELLELKPMF